MKKNFIFLTALCAVLSVNAQSPATRAVEVDPDLTYFTIDKSEQQVNGNFEEWIDIKDVENNVIGTRPRWWDAPEYSGNKIVLSPADDRSGTPASALKMNVGHASTWYTWHLSLKPVGGIAQPDYWNILIGTGEDYYISFWAKGEVGGEVLWMGMEQQYNPNWLTMPNFTLTTEWREYGFKTTAPKDLTNFQIQPRLKGIYYIDDISINYNDGSYNPPTSISTAEADARSLKVMALGDGRVSISTLQRGEATVSDITGKTIQRIAMADQTVEAQLPASGIYVVTFKSADNSISRKVVVR